MKRLENKIELFNMILERNELCRLNWNAYQRYNYWSNWAKRIKDTQLRELFALKNATNCLKSVASIDDAIKIRKENLNYTPRSTEFIKEKLLQYTNANASVYEFTRKTYKRRRQLQKMFNTFQRKNCVNLIEWIRVDEKKYSVNDMKLEIMDYETDKILLGNE